METLTRSFALFSIVLAGCVYPEQIENVRPNIILIMSDDQGWGDTGYNGHPFLKTPALDAMAANGVVFNRFYAASAVCSPTRGSALTGRHPLRYGICSANCGHIEDQEVTMAEMLKENGYTTGHFGKWHLGTLTRDTVDANRGGRVEHDQHYAPPWDHGFDKCFSTESKVPTWDPMVVPPKSAGDVRPDLVEGGPFGTYYWTGPDRIVTKDLEGDDSKIIMDRVIPFIDQANENNQPFFTVVWFHSPHLPVLTGEKFREQYGGLSVDQQHYYGTLSAMDDQIGRLRARLRKLNIEKNTIVFFTSDNGPEGIDVQGRTRGETNGLKGRKRSLHEGGIRVPGLLEWPGKLTPNVVNIPCFTSDYFPTVAGILGKDIEVFKRPFDGIDIMPIIEGEANVPERIMVFRFRQQVALIKNNFKLYSEDNGGTFKLFDLKADAKEQTDIAPNHSNLVTELTAHYIEWEGSFQTP